MLVIRTKQVAVFQQAALGSFEIEMVAHSQVFSPKLSKLIGTEQLHFAVRGALARASGYGLVNRGSMRLFVELMFLFGSAFDTDPQYPWAASILREPSPEMQRAEQLYQKVLDYQEKVSGPDAVNTRAALRNIAFLGQHSLSFSATDFVPVMLREMARAFPQKAACLGDRALHALIREGCAVAQSASFPTARGYALMVVLMFAFGHGCADDPLYPWIASTLKDERIADPAARALRLERKALTWLDHVLANMPEGART